ncbi:MAG: histidine kinase [Xanthobacteraceae bacterium]|nr:histidine kinase [Xanthobacteraceae bacterium]
MPAVIAFLLTALAILFSRETAVEAPLNAVTVDSHSIADQAVMLETVLAGLPQPVIALDVHGEVLAANAPARAVAPALRRGEPVSLALRVPEVLDAIRRAIASDVPQRVEFIERVPLERWYEAIVVPAALPGAALQPPARLVLVTLDDLTPLRRVEEMRADFVANASHELRTPLAALSGFIETLQGPAREDPVARAKFLSIMQAQATRMARLIDDLLSLSRIELNAHLRPNTRVELRGLVRQVVDGLQTLARDREVEVGVTASADQVEVLGDRDELLRVFENLIENALKYAASGKRVQVTLAADSVRNEARVAVRDFGPGIAPEHLPRLTERFYRVDVADSRAQGGTGLGLALVKHILNRHGGRLTIESVAGQGATFTAVLPLGATRAKAN